MIRFAEKNRKNNRDNTNIVATPKDRSKNKTGDDYSNPLDQPFLLEDLPLKNRLSMTSAEPYNPFLIDDSPVRQNRMLMTGVDSLFLTPSNNNNNNFDEYEDDENTDADPKENLNTTPKSSEKKKKKISPKTKKSPKRRSNGMDLNKILIANAKGPQTRTKILQRSASTSSPLPTKSNQKSDLMPPSVIDHFKKTLKGNYKPSLAKELDLAEEIERRFSPLKEIPPFQKGNNAFKWISMR